MINFNITWRSEAKIPLYQQLYEQVKDKIRSGQIPAGEKLPSRRKLASLLGLSLNTVETAFEQLHAEGYIRAIPQSGSYVCKLQSPLQIAPLTASIPADQDIPPPPEEQAACPFDLSTNQVDTSSFPFKTWSRTIKAVMQDHSQTMLQLAHPQGDFSLRQSLADYLHAFRGVNCQPDQIIIGAGTEYLLGLIVQLLGRNKRYAVENPGYRRISQIIKSNGATVRPIGLDADGIAVSQLEESKAEIVYVTPSHHFPTGIIMPVSRRNQLLRWASQSGRRYIIEDDYDSEFRFQGRPVPALQGLDSCNRVIYIGTFSKSLAPSIRISYLVLPMQLLAVYRQTLGFYSCTVSRFEQIILHRFMADGHFEKHLNRMRLVYRERKDALIKSIEQSPYSHQIEVIGENAGLHLMLRIGNSLAESELIRRAQAQGIKVHGLSEYYSDGADKHKNAGSSTAGTVVIGYANYRPQQIEACVECLLKAWFNG